MDDTSDCFVLGYWSLSLSVERGFDGRVGIFFLLFFSLFSLSFLWLRTSRLSSNE